MVKGSSEAFSTLLSIHGRAFVRTSSIVSRMAVFEIETLLIFRSVQSNRIDDAEMVVRDLSKGRIRRGEDSDNFNQGGVRDAGSTESLRDRDAPEAAPGQQFNLRMRKPPLSISHRRFCLQFPGDLMCCLDSLLIRTNSMSCRRFK